MKWMLFYKELDSSKSDPSNRKAFLRYVKDRDLIGFSTMLNENVESVYKTGLTKIISHEDGNEIFRMKQEKKLGIYPFVKVVKVVSKDEAYADGKSKVVEKGEKSVPIDQLKSRAIHTATIQNGKIIADLYVVAFDATIEEVALTSSFGAEGDRNTWGIMLSF